MTSTAAESLPIAQVCVDVRLPHLDRPFDYLIPDDLAMSAQPGVRVRVRLAGRLVNGFILSRTASSSHRVQPLERVISDVPVLLPSIAALARTVADRYAGTLADVLRAAVPPRHARAEKALLAKAFTPLAAPETTTSSATDWSRYRGGLGLRDRLIEGHHPRVVWSALPGEDPSERLCELTRWALPHGAVIIIAPNAREVAALGAAFARQGLGSRVCTLSADQGPQARYTAFLSALTQRSDIVIGTRAAAFAPTPRPALLVCWDEADESLVDPQFPGWNARDVLALRAAMSQEDADPPALLVGGYGRSVETQMWVESGWAVSITPHRDAVRACAPRILADPPEVDFDAARARVRDRVFPIVRHALTTGPVLVQVARRGYLPGLACGKCREIARCPACSGPLTLSDPRGAPHCAWCQVVATDHRCRHCGSPALRALAVGVDRTAEELSRAFPGTEVVSSSSDHMIAQVSADPAIVIATPGAEPVAPGGFHAVILLDAWAMAGRPGLRNSEETLRRWMFAASAAQAQAPVVITAPANLSLVQALIRWDAPWWAARDLAERAELGLPPVVRSATIQGGAAALEEVRGELDPGAHPQWRVLGPIQTRAGDSRLLVTVSRADGAEFTHALRLMQARRSAQRSSERIHLRVDPYHWGVDAP